MSVTKAVVFQKGEKVRPHFKNRRALGVGLALVFGTVGGMWECNIVQRGDGGVQRSKRSPVSLPTTQIPPLWLTPFQMLLLGVMHPSLVLNPGDRQTDSNVSAGMQQRIFMFDPTDKPERRVERKE